MTSYDLAPPPLLRKRDNLLVGDGEEPKSYDGEKARSSIDYSILSASSGVPESVLAPSACLAYVRIRDKDGLS